MNFIINSLNKQVTNAFSHKTPFKARILFGWRSKSTHFPQGGAKSDTFLEWYQKKRYTRIGQYAYDVTRRFPDLANIPECRVVKPFRKLIHMV